MNEVIGIKRRRASPVESFPSVAEPNRSAEASRVMGTWASSNFLASWSALAEAVGGIVNWDIPNAGATKGLTIRLLPSTTTYLVVQYGAPIQSVRTYASTDYSHPHFLHVATRMHTGIATIHPTGPLGLIAILLRPEAAARFLGERMGDFVDAKINLDQVFSAKELSLLVEMLAEARSSDERFACVQRFLLVNLREQAPEPIACQAAERLRRNPALRVQRLAADLGVSERNLSRRFLAMFGTGPKEFARAARLEKIAATRRSGSSWADVAYACGFVDQAHMINDVNAIIGATPDRGFGHDGFFAW